MRYSATMPKGKDTKLNKQSQKFIEAARELGCNESESAFDQIVKKVAKAAPTKQNSQQKKDKAA
jgi:hypothetical protein